MYKKIIYKILIYHNKAQYIIRISFCSQTFSLQGRELMNNVSKKILVTKASLAIHEVSRNMSGRYQCLASNVEGDALSNNLTISVLCKKGVCMLMLFAFVYG